MQGPIDGFASRVILTSMQGVTAGDGRKSTALRVCVQFHVLYRIFGGTGVFRELEALFEFSGSQLLTDFWKKEKTCLITPHFKKAA